MRPGETIEAPNMGMRVTCRESAAASGGELLSFDLGCAPAPRLRRCMFIRIRRSASQWFVGLSALEAVRLTACSRPATP